MRRLIKSCETIKSLKIWLHSVGCASAATLSYQDLGCRRTETTHNNEWAALNHVERAIGEWRQRLYALAFVLKADISSMWCKNDATYYTFDNFWETITASVFVAIQWFIHMSHVIIALTAQSWHLDFPKVVQAYTSGEVGILCTYLLRVYSETLLPIFI